MTQTENEKVQTPRVPKWKLEQMEVDASVALGIRMKREQQAAKTATTPQPRDIPPGKILLGEYGEKDVTENRAVVTTLGSAYSERVRAEVHLQHSSPGYECAGSCARWTNGYWAVRWQSMGATQGSRYKNDVEGEAKARAHFASLTTTTPEEN